MLARCNVKKIICFLIFLWIFSFLAINRTLYWDSYLHITLASDAPLVAKLDISTDKGNLFEHVFLGNISALDANKIHKVSIINTSAASNVSLNTRYTTLLSVTNDQKELNLVPFSHQDDVHMHHKYVLIHPQGKLAYSGEFSKSEIRFALPRHAGTSTIQLNDATYLAFDYSTLHNGQTFDIAVGKHDTAENEYKIRLPKSKFKKIILDLGISQERFLVTQARLVIHDRNLNSVPDSYKPNSVYPISLKVHDPAMDYKIEVPDNLLSANERKHHRIVIFASLFIAAIIAIIIYEILNLNILRIAKRLNADVIFIVGSISISVGIASYASWPALMQTDSMSTWAQVKYLEFNTWHSHFYSFFILSLSLLRDSPSTLTIVQSLLTIIIFSSFYLYLYFRGVERMIVFGLVGLNLLALPILLYPAFFVRDVLYVLLTLPVILTFAYMLYEKRFNNEFCLNLKWYIYLGIAVGMAILLREEGMYLMLLLPAMIWLTAKEGWRKPSMLFGASLCVFLIGSAPLQNFLAAHEDPNYKLTLAIEPLGEIIKDHYLSDDYQRDKEIINKIINYSDLANYHRDLEAFWSGQHVKFGRFNNVDIHNFIWLTKHLALRNPDKFFKNRTRVFFDAINSNTGNVNLIPYPPYEGASQWGWHQFERDKFYLGIYDDYLLGDFALRIQKKIGGLVAYTLKREDAYFTSPRSYIWSIVPALALTLFVLFFWPFFKIPALVSLVVLARTAILFLFQPMAHFKYHYDLYLWGPILLGLIALELHRRKMQRGLKYSHS